MDPGCPGPDSNDFLKEIHKEIHTETVMAPNHCVRNIWGARGRQTIVYVTFCELEVAKPLYT